MRSPRVSRRPWTNLEKQEEVQIVKAASNGLRAPLDADMKDDEIFVSKSSIHILKHHGSYMQQNRDLKKKSERDKSYQFMLRLKVPVGEIPAQLFRELDDLSNKYGQGDLRATTRQAFQLHGVLKSNLKQVIADIANAGSNTYGGCGDINRNIMAPPVFFPNNPAYTYCMQYSRAIADLFKPMTESFYELWLDGKKAEKVEYWQEDIQEFNLDQVRVHDNGNGIITGHPIEPLYGRTYLPKKFKIAFTVPGDNSVDLYINDIGCVVIMEADGKTLKGFNIVVGGGMGRTHRKEETFARAASHLGFVAKDDFFEAMKAILAVQRDHGNREVRSSARLKYLVHTLGIDKFRSLVEQYHGKKIEPWAPLPEWKFLDWLGWHDQGDGKLMLGVNIEQGRIRDTESAQIKTVLRLLVDRYDLPMILTPSQSIVLRNIEPKDKCVTPPNPHPPPCHPSPTPAPHMRRAESPFVSPPLATIIASSSSLGRASDAPRFSPSFSPSLPLPSHPPPPGTSSRASSRSTASRWPPSSTPSPASPSRAPPSPSAASPWRRPSVSSPRSTRASSPSSRRWAWRTPSSSRAPPAAPTAARARTWPRSPLSARDPTRTSCGSEARPRSRSARAMRRTSSR